MAEGIDLVNSLQDSSPDEWLRAEAKGSLGVDRKERVIRGFVVAQEGAFKTGRGEFSRKSLSTIVELMGQSPTGLKSRFTHPSLSGDGLGKFLGRARNPRKDTFLRQGPDGEQQKLGMVRADLFLSNSASRSPDGDLAGYIMDLAEEDPDALSSSLVLKKKDEVRLDEKTKQPATDADGKPLPAIWHPTKLHASDIVDTGDAVDGLLSYGLSIDDLPDAVVRQATHLLNQQFPNISREELRTRCLRWLDKYMELRYGMDEDPLDPNSGVLPVGQIGRYIDEHPHVDTLHESDLLLTLAALHLAEE